MFYINKDAFKKAGLAPMSRPRPGRKSSPRPRSSRPPASSACTPRAGRRWTHIENFCAWHNVPIGTKHNGIGGLDTRVHHQLAAARAPHRDAGRHVQEGPVHLRRPHQPGRRQVLQRRMRHVQRQRRGAGGHQEGGQVRLVRSASSPTTTTWPARRRTRSSAARRCGSWAARSPPSTRAWPSSWPSCPSRRSRCSGTPATGYVPITQAAYDVTRAVGLLRQEPGRRHADQATHQQGADRRIPRACASATSCRGAR